MSGQIVIGVDGGGSRTTAVAASKDGRLLSVAHGEGINYNTIGMDEARRRLRKVVEQLLQSCGAREIRFISVGMSALDGPATAEVLNQFAGGEFPTEKLILDSDANAALYAATLGGKGTIVICGTGSMVQSSDGRGNVRVGGGWGVVTGDPGSGYQLATDGLRAATAAWDGIAQPTMLCAEALAFFGADKPRSLIEKIYAPEMNAALLARFSKQVEKCAADGDHVAITVIERNMYDLASIAAATAFEAEGQTFWLYGGVFENSELMRKIFSLALAKLACGSSTRVLDVSPSVGALLYGYKMLGELTSEVENAIKTTYKEVF